MPNETCSRKVKEIKELYRILKKVRDVDTFTRMTGAVASVFQHIDDDFVRISTSLRDSDGNRATYVKLDRSSDAYHALMNGESFIGEFHFEDIKLFAKIAPFITDKKRGTIIALGVGVIQ